VWTIPEGEDHTFFDFANKFHTAIKFTCEMSSQAVTFLDTKVYKGSRYPHSAILDVQIHFKPTETFQYTHFSSCHPLSVKKGLVKGEALRLLRTNSVQEYFENETFNFACRLVDRGYPKLFVNKILVEIQLTSRQSALKPKNKTSNYNRRI
jgi:hypothetical protein